MSDQQQPEAFTATSLPPGITLQDVLAALATQSAAPPTLPSATDLASLTALPFTPDLLSATQHNSRAIHCLLCSTPILNPDTALHHPTTPPQHILPPFPPATPPQPTGGEQHSWLVGDQMAFENVGVTRGVEGGVRYLVCGNCDGGPIGCVYAEAPQSFYVLHGRIQYK